MAQAWDTREFKSGKEDWKLHTERLEQYFTANNITKKQAVSMPERLEQYFTANNITKKLRSRRSQCL